MFGWGRPRDVASAFADTGQEFWGLHEQRRRRRGQGPGKRRRRREKRHRGIRGGWVEGASLGLVWSTPPKKSCDITVRAADITDTRRDAPWLAGCPFLEGWCLYPRLHLRPDSGPEVDPNQPPESQRMSTVSGFLSSPRGIARCVPLITTRRACVVSVCLIACPN